MGNTDETQLVETQLDWTAWLHDQRHRAINLLLGSVVLIGPLGLATSLRQAVIQRSVSINLPVYLLSYGLVVLLFVLRKVRDEWRALGFVILMYAFGAFSLYTGWLASSGRVFLVSLIVVATLLVNPNAGKIAAAISMLTYAVFALGYSRDWLELRDLPDPTTSPPMIIEGVGLALAIALIVAGLWFFEQALKAATRANAQAQAAHVLLEQRANQLEIANDELEAFTYSVSHDLRAPLRAINGYSRALQEEYLHNLGDDGKSYLQHIQVSAHNMAQLIDGLLRLSRLTRAEMNIQVVNLSAIAEQVAGELRASQPERQVAFHIKPGLTVQGDATMLQILMQNLLENAWKFTSHHPHARIDFESQDSSGEVIFLVRDDGAGFDIAYADKLFIAFQRLHSADQFEGLGIGLATVGRIIQRHGGRIWAEGAVEQGTTVFFTL